MRHKWLAGLALLTMIILTGFSASPVENSRRLLTATPTPTPPGENGLFDYEQDAPLDIEEVGVTNEGEAAVHDITFASPVNGEPIRAYLVVPPGEGPFPGVLFVHWLGRSRSDRREFLNEAVTLAGNGVVSLLVDAIWNSENEFPWTTTDAEADIEQTVRQAIDLRRAVDLLVSRPDVDPERLAYVGHDFGAMMGGILAGVEDRFDAYVLMAAAPRFTYWLARFSGLDDDAQAAYDESMALVDPGNYIGEAAPAAILFQFSDSDQWTPEEQAQEFFDAASEPKEILWYSATHQFNHREAQADRLAWLLEQLGVEGAE